MYRNFDLVVPLAQPHARPLAFNCEAKRNKPTYGLGARRQFVLPPPPVVDLFQFGGAHHHRDALVPRLVRIAVGHNGNIAYYATSTSGLTLRVN